MKGLVVQQLYLELVALLLLLLQQGGHALVPGAQLNLSNEGVQVLVLVGNLFGVALVSVLARIPWILTKVASLSASYLNSASFLSLGKILPL